MSVQPGPMTGRPGRRPRVVVGVSRSPASVLALRRGAREAAHRDAVLVPAHAWRPPAILMPPGYPVQAANAMARNAGWALLWETFDAAFRETPWGGDVEPVVVHGCTGTSLLRIADRADDLLVLGVGHRNLLRTMRHTLTARYCIARAKCDVLIVTG